MSHKYYLLIENIAEPILIELKILPHNDGYLIFWKNNIRDNIPKSLYNKLVKRGLSQSQAVGETTNDKRTSVYRLVACLYQNILGLDVHHMKKNVNLNSINELVPVEIDYHRKVLDKLPPEECITESLKLQQEWKKKIFDKRSTLAQNGDIIKNVMELLKSGKNPFQIEELVKGIKSRKIYDHKNYFYYWDDFIKWYENQTETDISEIDANFKNRWKHVLDFEKN